MIPMCQPCFTGDAKNNPKARMSLKVSYSTPTHSHSSVSKFVSRNDVLKAEIIWASSLEKLSSGFLSKQYSNQSPKLTRSKFTYGTFQKAKNKGSDQTEVMHRLVCACVVRKPPKTVFLVMRPIWTLQTVMRHASYSSNGNVNQIFQAMFADSEIAKKFALGEMKMAYICVWFGRLLKKTYWWRRKKDHLLLSLMSL